MPTERALLDATGIKLGLSAAHRDDAVDQVGRTLVEIGAVDQEYVDAMHERERSVSTYVGEGVAIPHGTNESRQHVRRTALVVLQFPDGVAWEDNTVRMCVGIAANGDEQVGILSSLARILMDSQRAAELRQAEDTETVMRILQSMDEETV